MRSRYRPVYAPLPAVAAIYAGYEQLTAQTEVDSRYSYGWHRAEILAALVNGVFLLALCFSISLEAIERFFSTPGAYMTLALSHSSH